MFIPSVSNWFCFHNTPEGFYFIEYLSNIIGFLFDKVSAELMMQLELSCASFFQLHVIQFPKVNKETLFLYKW